MCRECQSHTRIEATALRSKASADVVPTPLAQQGHFMCPRNATLRWANVGPLRLSALQACRLPTELPW